MHTANNDVYNEQWIKDAEKRTERYKSKKHMKEINRVISGNLFKNFFDFPPDEDELDDGIEQF